MNFKERIMTAMNHEEPDQVPVMGLIMDPSTVNQIMGKEPVDFVAMIKNPDIRDSIKDMMNQDEYWNSTYQSNWNDALESSLKLGFDANWTIYAFMQLAEDSESSLGGVYGKWVRITRAT